MAVADDLATDAAYIEDCRYAAWTERPAAERDRYWDAEARKFNFPEGWPDGVEAEAYVRAEIARAAPPPRAEPPPPIGGPATPSVRRMRAMLR